MPYKGTFRQTGKANFPGQVLAYKRRMMWILLITLLTNVPSINTVTVLQTYATVEECQTERNRIGFEMAEAYPYERDFVITCELIRRHES